MPNRLTAQLTLLLSLILLIPVSHADVIKIGVLSDKDFRTTMKAWDGTADYLKQQLPQHVFQILPYSKQSDLVIDLEKNKLDFLLTGKQNLAPIVADFPFVPILNAKNNTTQWVLARHHNMPYTVTYSITDALLKLSARHQAKAGYITWKLASNTEIQLSTRQKIKQLYNQLCILTGEILNKYWAIFIAALLSATLILLYRQWDRYHTRIAEVNKHRQQPRDPNLSNTVS